MSSGGAASTDTFFHEKYLEFCRDLGETYTEKAAAIQAAAALNPEERLNRFRTEVATHLRGPAAGCPGRVLPGVEIEEAHWATFSEGTKKAIYEHIALLTFCSASFTDISGNTPINMAWAEDMMKQWKEKLNTMDFKKLSEKFMKFFETAGGAAGGAGAAAGSAIPKLPEKFLKGQLAKLAEELVREFRPEDFGFSAEELAAADRNPAQAFEMLFQVYSRNPDKIQNAMKRIARRLQEKVQRGQLRPQELVKEAEEMIREFQENPAFVELMESFRTMFGGGEDEEGGGRRQGGDARLALARSRLRKKLEARKAGKK